MTTPRDAVAPPVQPLWRVGRGDRPWGFPDWQYSTNGRFPGRWDDPDGQYRTIHCATSRVGAFLEALRDFRPSASEMAAVDDSGEGDAFPPRLVPRAWLRERVIGSAIVKGSFANVLGSTWVGYLNRELQGRFAEWGIKEIDGSTLRSTATRAITQAASRLVYLASERSNPLFTGVRYESRFGNDIECWAIFEHADVAELPFTFLSSDQVDADDEDLQEACRIHGIAVEGVRVVEASAGGGTEGAPSSAWR
jgi:RES domain